MIGEDDAREMSSGRTHLYQDISNRLRERIAAGEFSSGVLLPSELQLAQAYGVSRLTVKRALNLLRDEGLLDARRGVGWFVAGKSVRHDLNRLGSVQQDIVAAGFAAQNKIREFAFIEADAHVASVLGTNQVLKITRVDIADGRPVSRVTTWCPAALAQHLSMAEVEKSSLSQVLPVDIVSATQVIRAVGASAEDAAELQIPVGTPCLLSERTTYASNGEVVIYGTATLPGHSAEYVAELRSSGDADRPGMRLSAPSPVSDADPAMLSSGDTVGDPTVVPATR